MNTYSEIEKNFYDIACSIYDMHLSPEELKANRELYNTLATAAYGFFEAVALRSSANARAIALAGCDPCDFCSEVTMHYLNKFHRLWESSSPEYYMASVMTQVNRKVLDLIQKHGSVHALSTEEIDLFLADPFDLQKSYILSEDVNNLVSLLANQVRGMDSVFFLARFALNIKPGVLAEELTAHSPKEVAAAVLKTCARQTMIDPVLLKQIAWNVMTERSRFDLPVSETLSEQISDRIYETKRYIKRAMQKSRTAHI